MGNVEGKDCILTDDITTTAGTLCAAAKMAKAHGARPVRAAVSHRPITELYPPPRSRRSEELITMEKPAPQASWDSFLITVLSVADLLGMPNGSWRRTRFPSLRP